MPDLALDDISRMPLKRLFVLLQAQHVHRVRKRCQRVAQFMAQHGQELVLAAIQVDQRVGLFLQLALKAAALGNVVQTDDGSDDFTVAIFQRNYVGNDVDARAVGPLHHDFHVMRRCNIASQHGGHRRLRMRQRRAVWKM